MPLEVSFRLNADAGPAFRQAAKIAIREEAEAIMAESRDIHVPIDTGHLKSTGKVQNVVDNGSEITVSMGYSADYAEEVHENLRAFHRVGRAKYLETPLMEAYAGMSDRVRARIRRLIGG